MECRKITELIPLAVGGELVPTVAERVRRHIRECGDCQAIWDMQVAAFDALRIVFASEKEIVERQSPGMSLVDEVIGKLEMTCTQASRLAPLAAGGELPPSTARRLQWHCEKCPNCRRELQIYATLREKCRATGTTPVRVFDDSASFWAELEPRLEREAIFTASSTVVETIPARPTRFAALRFWAAAAALLLLGLFAGFKLGSGRLHPPPEPDRPSAQTDAAGRDAEREVGILLPEVKHKAETPAPESSGVTVDAGEFAGMPVRLPRMTPIGASNVPFALGSLHGETQGKANAIQIILVPSGAPAHYEIQQIKIVPADSRHPREF